MDAYQLNSRGNVLVVCSNVRTIYADCLETLTRNYREITGRHRTDVVEKIDGNRIIFRIIWLIYLILMFQNKGKVTENFYI